MARPKKAPGSRFVKQPYTFPPDVHKIILSDYVKELIAGEEVSSASEWVANAVVQQYERETKTKFQPK